MCKRGIKGPFKALYILAIDSNPKNEGKKREGGKKLERNENDGKEERIEERKDKERG